MPNIESPGPDLRQEPPPEPEENRSPGDESDFKGKATSSHVNPPGVDSSPFPQESSKSSSPPGLSSNLKELSSQESESPAPSSGEPEGVEPELEKSGDLSKVSQPTPGGGGDTKPSTPSSSSQKAFGLPQAPSDDNFGGKSPENLWEKRARGKAPDDNESPKSPDGAGFPPPSPDDLNERKEPGSESPGLNPEPNIPPNPKPEFPKAGGAKDAVPLPREPEEPPVDALAMQGRVPPEHQRGAKPEDDHPPRVPQRFAKRRGPMGTFFGVSAVLIPSLFGPADKVNAAPAPPPEIARVELSMERARRMFLGEWLKKNEVAENGLIPDNWQEFVKKFTPEKLKKAKQAIKEFPTPEQYARRFKNPQERDRAHLIALIARVKARQAATGKLPEPLTIRDEYQKTEKVIKPGETFSSVSDLDNFLDNVSKELLSLSLQADAGEEERAELEGGINKFAIRTYFETVRAALEAREQGRNSFSVKPPRQAPPQVPSF